MDRVDAPRIAIPPDAPSPPQAPEETTVATRNEATGEVGNDAKTGGGGASSEEAGNEGSNADSKQADSEKAAIDGDTQTENAEESKPDSIDTPEELKSGNKPDSESADKASDTAEEEQVNDPPTAVAAEEPKKSIRSDAPKSDEELTISTIDSAAEPAAQRPDWVSAQPKRVGEVQQEVIVTDEWSTEAECERARDIGLMLKTYEHIQAMFGVPYQRQASDHRMNSDDAWNDQRLHQLASAGIMLDFARREIAKEEHVETVQRSFGPMKKLYTLVAFSPAVDRELRHKWEAYQRQERFAMVGIGAGSILGLVGLAYGLLKADTLTKGYYSKRLFIGVPAAIISTLALLALMNS
jgi:hypothetical protein